MFSLLTVYGNIFYMRLGASISFVVFAMAVARSVDVVSDPLMSQLTDSFKSSWGRRRPFMLSGAPFYALGLVLLLSPPNMNTDDLSAWFTVFYIFFFLTNTWSNIPYDALGPELTDNYLDRSNMYAVAGTAEGVGTLLAMLSPAVLMLYKGTTYSCVTDATCRPDSMGNATVSDWNGDVHAFNVTAAASDRAGYSMDRCTATSSTANVSVVTSGLPAYCACIDRSVSGCSTNDFWWAMSTASIIFAVIYLVSMTICVFTIKERPRRDAANPPIVAQVLNTLKNRPFAILLPAWICDAVVYTVVGTMMSFFVAYVVSPEHHCKMTNVDASSSYCSTTVWRY